MSDWTRMNKRFVAATLLAALTTAVASAQGYPGDPGAGVERGIQQLNDSGQVGTVTLFRRAARTAIFVVMHGVSPGRTESVRVYRGQDCDALESSPRYFLSDLKGGVSRTEIALSEERLLSGNYNVVVFLNNRPGAAAAACGHLY